MTVDHARAVDGIIRALDDPYAENRREAALAAWHLGIADPDLVEALGRRASADESERVRSKADDALRALGRR
ncbi:hypothetical protein [Solirubrobacter ginsenosidimutans]|uniref:hypothetical protein n=1 Tax=Solirubrobacter ginsenosidimutans TaxID=490573 RepID=UPI0022CE1FBB|nr:hypothetical protein [Solirubrobacter ginsenosidimutans]